MYSPSVLIISDSSTPAICIFVSEKSFPPPHIPSALTFADCSFATGASLSKTASSRAISNICGHPLRK